MFRKIVALVAVLSTFALGGCFAEASSQHRLKELSAWVDTQPALADLHVSRPREPSLFGDSYSHTLQAKGEVHANSVAEFFTALDQLYARFDELPRGKRRWLDVDVKADIQGTEFTWTGREWEPGKGERLVELLEPFAAPEVGSVDMREDVEVFWVEVSRDFQVTDEAAHAYRDRAFRHLDSVKGTEMIQLSGFPLLHRTDPGGTRGFGAGSPSLRFSEFPQGYVGTATLAETVDAATPYAVRAVTSYKGMYRWEFYADDDYDEEALKLIKQLLSHPDAGSPIEVKITSRTRVLGVALIGAKQEYPPKKPGPWQEDMDRVFYGS
ncbi:hypothetical protein [Corynebacterium tuscaniense]|uniref:hypothetical protein n=1 Tax=Corynebacterium tuscaniense TaxID=302449 RepID=UPI00050E8FD9|nr:hypothetical protein [Corynebacterium tuscaniense]KAA8735899.1 hypothetical protein F4V54_07310 [Corynebacterium tuscaniense]KGF23027.1 hypothetical protein HMPREF2129_05990 [Corynebacterium tuscaniense DNF00037]